MPILTDEERIGTELAGKYRLDAVLGRGGMGVVFAATHVWTARRVAVKILHPEFARDEVIIQRFLREARAASALRHPNVVDVLDMGQEPDGTVYLVLELLEGESLAARMGRRRIAIAELSTLLLPVIDALAVAHDHGVVHRDLKPENIFIARLPSGSELPKVLDFGIAKVTDGAQANVRSTQAGAVVGTPAYMSPEQAQGLEDVGPSADIWSMGVVWFECLSRRLPFEAASAVATIVLISTKQAPPLATYAPKVPAWLASAVDRALARDPAERFPNMRAFAVALRDEGMGEQVTNVVGAEYAATLRAIAAHAAHAAPSHPERAEALTIDAPAAPAAIHAQELYESRTLVDAAPGPPPSVPPPAAEPLAPREMHGTLAPLADAPAVLPRRAAPLAFATGLVALLGVSAVFAARGAPPARPPARVGHVGAPLASSNLHPTWVAPQAPPLTSAPTVNAPPLLPAPGAADPALGTAGPAPGAAHSAVVPPRAGERGARAGTGVARRQPRRPPTVVQQW